ncbi:MAG TPA: hypothetical protein PLB83_00025 [Bacillota bacterium]|nr:hypothetical protein [Bacillota bacterium]
MTNYQEIINSYTNKLTEKLQKQLDLQLLVRLNEKLLEEQNENIELLLKETVDFLKIASSGDKAGRKAYKKQFNKLKKAVRTEYGYIPKGTLVGEYMALGIAIGIGFGSAFIAINPALMIIGLPIGVALGLSIGQNKEKEADSENKLY